MTLPPFSDGSELEVGRFRALRLTLFGVLTRRQLTECTMRALVIVIVPPGFDQFLSMCDRHEAVHVQAHITQTAIETVDQRRSPLACLAE